MKPSPPPVNHYNLFADGIESPLRCGIRRALKYANIAITDREIEMICDTQASELTIWFCDTYDLGGDDLE